MNIADVTFLTLLLGFVLNGFWFGFVHMAGALLGIVVGIITAGWLYVPASAKFLPYFGEESALSKVIAFSVIFLIANRLVSVLVWVVSKMLNIATFIPFAKMVNRLAGAVIGLVEGTLVLGLGAYFALRFPLTPAIDASVAASSVAHALAKVGGILAGLLPAAIRAVQSAI